MRARLTLATIVSCVSWAASQAIAAPVNLDGDWIGGFETYDGPVFVTAHFDEKGSTLTGNMGVPMRDDQRVALENVAERDAHVSFELPSRNGNLKFEGNRKDRRVSGHVHQGNAARDFELIKLTPVTPDLMAAVTGDYELSPGRVLLITQTNGSLLYLDQEANRIGMLYAVDANTFISGPSLVAGYPVETTVTFDRAADGHVSSLIWKPTKGAAQRAMKKEFYSTEEVIFPSGDIHLAGTLLKPLTPGPHPALVMLHGSGPATRDSLAPFADIFARNGIAVLIHDKRGTGGSTGNWNRATFDDLASDALAAVAYLKTRPEINAKQIGLQGTSFGGWVAPLAASRSSDVAFVIVESAPAVSPLEHERLRVRAQLHADGFSPDVVVRALAFMDRKFEVARTGQGWQKLEDAMKRANDEGWLSYVNPPSSLESLQWNWTYLLSYDPRPALEKVTCPILVLYGQLDTIVPAAENREKMEAALKRAGNHDTTIKVFEKANHGFFAAITGGRREGPSLKGLVPGYLQARVDWLRQHVPAGTDAAADIPIPGAPLPAPALTQPAVEPNATDDGGATRVSTHS